MGYHVTGKQRALALVLVSIMLAAPWGSMPLAFEDTVPLEDRDHPQPVNQLTQLFPVADGFTYTNLSQSPNSGITTLERPSISWSATSGFGLTNLRTGACSAYLPATDEVFLIGGRIDGDPTQTGDESPTKTVEIFDVANQEWTPAVEELKEEQQYHKCAVVDNKIYAIGDHHPYETPSVQATGVVQVYDPANGNWSYGTSMPATKSVGLAGVASQNGMIYVAGGVSLKDRSDATDRLMRYDPVNDTWTEMATMNHTRHSFELVSFRGKLIAYGGVAEFFDPIANTTVEGETNLTESYDPITDSWTQLPNATHAMSAYAAAVYNDEIVIVGGYSISGWQASLNDKTYGYDPFVNRWDTYATSQIGFFDSTLARANSTLVYASGDSSNTRFSTWSVQYMAENECFVNPALREGWLTSATQDMRPNAHGSASPIWLNFDASTPQGTELGLQYRTAETAQGIAAASWKPTTVPAFSYLSEANHSLSEVPENRPFIQYRAKYTTTEIMDWVTPSLQTMSLGYDDVAFLSQLPETMQPTSTPITVQTKHHGATQEGDYVLAMHATNEIGTLEQTSQWTHMRWNSSTSTLTIDDPAGLLFNQQADAVQADMTSDGHTMNWSFSLSGILPTDYLRFKASTHALRNTTYIHPDIVSIDREVAFVVTNITADASSQGGAEVLDEEVLPGNAGLNISIDHAFKNSGLRLMGGAFQARIHVDILTFDRDINQQRIWFNESSEWFDLPAGQLYHALLNLPEGVSGNVSLWFEARTSEDWTLSFSTEPHQFVVNGDGPTLLSVVPALDTYLNENPYQTVSFDFHDVGGFDNQSLHAYSWIEARDDGSNGNPADGIPQRNEYQPSIYYLYQDGNRWLVNITVNDTINDDHQWARILLEGDDLAGFGVPAATAADGHARWESRTPLKAELVSIEPVGQFAQPDLLRFEPKQKVGWSLTVRDANGFEDINEVRIELGNDERLGFAYTTVDGICAPLDERLIMLPGDCIVRQVGQELLIDFSASVAWSFTLAGVIQGEVDIYLRDYDGIQHYDESGAWILQRELSIEVESLRDDTGAVKQAIEEGVSVMSGDALNLSATITHSFSGTPYTGDLRLGWNGLQQNDNWRGSAAISVVDGAVTYGIPTPEGSGLMHDIVLSLWDPLEVEQLSSYDVPSFRLDGRAPQLLPTTISADISRYHLDAVDIGVNILEEQGWSSSVTLNCQIRSLDSNWNVTTLTRNSTTIFDGKTMFSFSFDFSQLGDPSTLSQQANLMCWAEGTDDAGWELTSEVGNSEFDPWLEAPLNNIGPDLALEKVELTQEVAAGENVRLSFFVVNEGETIDAAFNVSIELVQGEKRTLIGRSIFTSMDENTAKSVKRSFDAPDGTWTIEITVDQEGLIWEIDETNNMWVTTQSSESGGFGAVIIAGGGISILVLAGAFVMLRRRQATPVDEAKIVAALGPTSGPEGAPPTPEAPAKRRGPPGGKISTTPGQKPSKGPPRGPPKSSAPVEEISPQATAALYMDALGPATTEASDEAVSSETHASDYSQLPGGGEYEYTPDATYYVGATCGRWILNEDKSFTRLPDEA